MEKVIARRSIGRFMVINTTKFVLFCACAVLAAHYVVAGWAEVRAVASLQGAKFMRAITRVEVVREYVKPQEYSLSALIDIIAKDQHVPAVVLRAIVLQESAGGTQLYRFEPTKYTQLKSKARVSDSELRMLASSHGVAQVMGFNAEPRCGIHWSQLYDQALGLECGAKILRENLDRHKEIKSPAAKLRLALRDYNGSGADADDYSVKVMARVGDLLYADLRTQL